jgi:hypothetical protein
MKRRGVLHQRRRASGSLQRGFRADEKTCAKIARAHFDHHMKPAQLRLTGRRAAPGQMLFAPNLLAPYLLARECLNVLHA